MGCTGPDAASLAVPEVDTSDAVSAEVSDVVCDAGAVTQDEESAGGLCVGEGSTCGEMSEEVAAPLEADELRSVESTDREVNEDAFVPSNVAYGVPPVVPSEECGGPLLEDEHPQSRASEATRSRREKAAAILPPLPQARTVGPGQKRARLGIGASIGIREHVRQADRASRGRAPSGFDGHRGRSPTTSSVRMLGCLREVNLFRQTAAIEATQKSYRGVPASTAMRPLQ